MNPVQDAAIEVAIWERRLEYHREHGDHRWSWNPASPFTCDGCEAIRAATRYARKNVDRAILREAERGDSHVWEPSVHTESTS